MPIFPTASCVHDVVSVAPAAATDLPRLQVRAKFFFEGETKFYLQGVTYGPFRPATDSGPNLPEPERVALDFGLMRELGVNVLRVYHTPPRWFLDLARDHRLRVMVTIPWHKRVLFLDNREAVETIRQNVAKAALANAGHPALLGFFIDNEIPPDLVRWYGARRMEEFLNSLVRIVKKNDPLALAAYANFPPTEYLLPSEVDFYSYNVYLHRRKDLAGYLGRLQNLAGDKPLILSEFGMDTIRHPEEEQARLLTEHVTTVFENGLAGTFIFSWTDEWFTDGVDVTDWAFGIVTAERRPKLSYRALQPLLKNPERPLYQRFVPAAALPMVSVVVCSYNGARTLRDCLNSLQHLHYPNYEVVFIDDGSKDNTQEIMKEFPGVRNIAQVNKGLSAARNAGIAAAQGEVVAFTDSDCMADRDWLYFLVHALLSADFAAVGGPNISPPATDWIQATVGAAPGSPSHVLLTDTIAEHVPGCNMAYHKWALEEIGGFDPEYRKAGDDVDVCWRLMQRGYVIGFSPAAVVWHYRRFEVSTYFSQQSGYGEAEAMLRYKHLQYFGPTGSAIWHGNVYSQVRMDSFFSRPVIYHGIFGTGLFQCIYPKRYSPFAGLLAQPRVAGGDPVHLFPLDAPRLAAADSARHVRTDAHRRAGLHGAGADRDQIRQHSRAAPAALPRHHATVAAGVGALLHLAARQADAPRRHRGEGGRAPSRGKLARVRQPRLLERDRPGTLPPAAHDGKAARRGRLEIFPRYRLDELGHARLRQPLVESAPALDERDLSARTPAHPRGKFPQRQHLFLARRRPPAHLHPRHAAHASRQFLAPRHFPVPAGSGLVPGLALVHPRAAAASSPGRTRRSRRHPRRPPAARKNEGRRRRLGSRRCPSGGAVGSGGCSLS